DKEWGYGDEDPKIFAPTSFDAGQWARVARESGMSGLILTAKHHDGFCLWPSAFTDHTVASSSYGGDIVGAFVEAARAEGLRVGLYLSPWDRNHPEYGRDAYVEYFRAQWKELIEAYGPLFEIWFDGANGGDGFYGGARETRRIDRTTYYDWPTTNALVQSWNPGVIIFSDAGPGCRWVGNERGFSSETSWQTINLDGMYPGVSHDHLAQGDRGGTHWVGVEVDVSIRPGWFWHESQNAQVKTPEQLVEIWYASVGRGANLLLNVPPDRRGLFHERDVESLRGMRAILDATFDEDLLSGGTVHASNVRGGDQAYGASHLLDGDRRTFWATDDGVTTGSVEVILPEARTFDVIRVREGIELGQRVESFGVDAWTDGGWHEVARGTTIGPCRVVRFEAVTTDRVRLRIESSMACPVISELGA
ncbi:MAG: alpha-L-fucosidase, partial [Phycisphaerales bacterium]|nr:alpha-L-fucosidase [Phycisphaerales bacterium]